MHEQAHREDLRQPRPELTTLPAGSHVRVRLDDGSDLFTRTASPPWQLGDGTWVVRLLDGPAGGYALERVCEWGPIDLRLRNVWRGIAGRLEDRVVFVEAGREWNYDIAAGRIVDVLRAVYGEHHPADLDNLDVYNLNHASTLIEEATSSDQASALLEIGSSPAGPTHVRDPLIACRATATELLLNALANIRST